MISEPIPSIVVVLNDLDEGQTVEDYAAAIKAALLDHGIKPEDVSITVVVRPRGDAWRN